MKTKTLFDSRLLSEAPNIGRLIPQLLLSYNMTRRVEWYAAHLAIVLIAILFVPARPSLAQHDLNVEQCYRVELDKSQVPLWMVSGAWDDKGTSLLWLDAARQEIQQVFLNGEISARELSWQEDLKAGLMPERDLQGPAWIWNTKEGFLLEYKFPPQIHSIGKQLDKKGTHVSVSGLEKSSGAKLLAAFALTPLDKGFLAFGDILEPEKPSPPNAGFLYLDGLGNMQALEKVPLNDDLRQQHIRYYMPYLAAIEDAGFILFLKKEPFLSRVEFNPRGSGVQLRKLKPLPLEFRSRPLLKKDPYLKGRPWEQETRFYQTLQESNLAAGIYTWENSLYLLGKLVTQVGNEWWLLSMDPVTGEELHRVHLPTNASSLTVIFGPKYTALVEKGPVSSITKSRAPYMEIRHMVLVPTKWIKDRGAWPAGTQKLPCASISHP